MKQKLPSRKKASLTFSVRNLTLALMGLSISLSAEVVKAGADNDPKVLFGYYSNWSTYERNYQPSNIPMSDLTGVLYAFAQIGNCATPYATDTNPTLCNTGSYADGKQDYKLYSSDPYSDYKIIPTKFPSGRKTGYGYPGSTGLGNMASTINLAHASQKVALLSIGGYTLSVPFFTMMQPNHSKPFVDSVIDFLGSVKADNKGVGFDGVDIDWEPNDNQWSFLNDPVSGEQTLQNYLTLLSELRYALDNHNPTYNNARALLTIAVPASPETIEKAEKVYPGFWRAVAAQVDDFNIMAYDYHGAFDVPAITNFMAPLKFDRNQPLNVVGRESFNAEATIAAYKNVGVPTNKLILGFPSYGRATTGVAASSPSAYPDSLGLYQNFTGAPSGEFNDGTGVYNYNYILNTMLAPKGGYTATYVANLGTTAYNPAAQMFIAYDNVTNVQEKADFVLDQQLGGMMEWELSGDLLSTDLKYKDYSLLHEANTEMQKK